VDLRPDCIAVLQGLKILAVIIASFTKGPRP
jgi:hypothetical protein